MFSQAATMKLTCHGHTNQQSKNRLTSMNDQTNISLEVFKLFLISDWQNGKETIVSKNNSEPICERTPRACHFMNETLPFE
jgi:hypothetical protein